MKTRVGVGLTALSVLLAAACSQSPAPAKPEAAASAPAANVLATVGGSPVTEPELELAIHDNLGPEAALLLDAAGRRKVLESLVVSRAMAQQAEQALDDEARAELARRVAAYREQLLVKDYLRAQITPEPVTGEMVETYYREHPERFGAVRRWDFELLESQSGLDDKARDAALATVNGAADQGDWAALAKASGGRLTYRRASAAQGTLEPALDGLLMATAEGKVSDVRLSAGVVRRVRVLKLEQTAPKPLAEVSNEIRQALLPIQLKKAVKLASDKVLAETTVTYGTPAPGDAAPAKTSR